MTHPKEALFESGKSLPIIPTCEHFAGSEKLILKGFEMQKNLDLFLILLVIVKMVLKLEKRLSMLI